MLSALYASNAMEILAMKVGFSLGLEQMAKTLEFARHGKRGASRNEIGRDGALWCIGQPLDEFHSFYLSNYTISSSCVLTGYTRL
jgi:hypothetical protein